MASEKFRVAVPLFDFDWPGDSFTEFPGLSLLRARPDLRDLDKDDLTSLERSTMARPRHWLTFEWHGSDSPAAGETVNLFLVSLWLARPTETHVKYYFKVNTDNASQHLGQLTRVFTQFSFIPGYVRPGIRVADLRRASRYYRVLLDVATTHGRLYQALVLNVAGCWSHPWHISFICHGAAAEALLTFSRGGGITRRLATAFACLTRRSNASRDAAFRRFLKIYDTRSDIMHGRIHNIPKGGKLRRLASMERAMRDLWRTILTSAAVRMALEGPDTQRQAFLTTRQGAYRPPP